VLATRWIIESGRSIPAAGDSLSTESSPTLQPGDPPCIVNLRTTRFRAGAMRQRFRASRERGRLVWRAHPTLYRSYLSWSIVGAIVLASSCALLAHGASLSGAILGVALSAAWAGAWIWVISFHVGLVRPGEFGGSARASDPGQAGARVPLHEPRATLGLPNVLTLLRILLVPAVGWAIVAHPRLEPYATAALLAIFLVGFSDVLDGVLARLLDWQTLFGRSLDHLADVLIVNVVAITEHAAGILPGWLMVLIVIRYAGTGIGGVIVLMMVPGAQITPTWIGKVATFIAGWTLFLSLAHHVGRWPLTVAMPWLFAASGVTLAANVGVLAYQVLRRERPAA
jgi:cardiolipin synthase (CMP-forming)